MSVVALTSALEDLFNQLSYCITLFAMCFACCIACIRLFYYIQHLRRTQAPLRSYLSATWYIWLIMTIVTLIVGYVHYDSRLLLISFVMFLPLYIHAQYKQTLTKKND
jgi:hypothetical protein